MKIDQQVSYPSSQNESKVMTEARRIAKGQLEFFDNMMASRNQHQIDLHQKLFELLEFYANGDHIVTLSGNIDWVSERKNLQERGFDRVFEAYNGEELFVEDGSKAKELLADISTSAKTSEQEKQKLVYEKLVYEKLTDCLNAGTSSHQKRVILTSDQRNMLERKYSDRGYCEDLVDELLEIVASSHKE